MEAVQIAPEQDFHCPRFSFGLLLKKKKPPKLGLTNLGGYVTVVDGYKLSQ